MPCFVAEEIHAKERTDAAAGNGNPDQSCLWNAPAAMLCFLLIRKHKKKAGSIDYDEVQKNGRF